MFSEAELSSLEDLAAAINDAARPDCKCEQASILGRQLRRGGDWDSGGKDAVAKAVECIRHLQSLKDKCDEIILIETGLREVAARLRDDITVLQKSFFARSAGDRESFQDQIEQKEEILEVIDEVIPVTARTQDPMILDFEDYGRHFYGFTAGYEFATIDKLFEDGFPRTGFTVLQRYGGTDREKSGPSLRSYGFHTTFTAILTSSAEQPIEPPENTAADDPPATPPSGGSQTSFEFAGQLFWVWARGIRFDDDRLAVHFGPLLEAGGKKSDGQKRVDARGYFGFRAALNPEVYADMLVGRTQSLDSLRLEVRGQLPVWRFANGSRIFLGAIGNFALDSEANAVTMTDPQGDIVTVREEEEDVIRVYVGWRVDFGALFARSD